MALRRKRATPTLDELREQLHAARDELAAADAAVGQAKAAVEQLADLDADAALGLVEPQVAEEGRREALAALSDAQARHERAAKLVEVLNGRAAERAEQDGRAAVSAVERELHDVDSELTVARAHVLNLELRREQADERLDEVRRVTLWQSAEFDPDARQAAATAETQLRERVRWGALSTDLGRSTLPPHERRLAEQERDRLVAEEQARAIAAKEHYRDEAARAGVILGDY